MIQILNQTDFEEYEKNLNNAISNKTTYDFMMQNQFFGIHLVQSNRSIPCPTTLSAPYYDEIPIESVISWNSPDCTIRCHNWSRVVKSVEYILKNNCMPISVIKLAENEYYIENGKHRFYAHLLLKKNKIPVSVKSIVQTNDRREHMLRYNIPFYDCDGIEIAYPEKVEEFVNKYINMENRIRSIEEMVAEIAKSLVKFKADLSSHIEDNIIDKFEQHLRRLHDFKYEIKCLHDDFFDINLNVQSVEMKQIDSNRQVLFINMPNNKEIIVDGVLSSGNRTRASQCTCNILNKFGFQVDMTYITNHLEFKLLNKRDAHNIDFSSKIDEYTITNLILPNIDKKTSYDINEDVKKDFFKFMDYISHYIPFETPGTNFSLYSSSFIKVKSDNYYLVGAEDKNGIDSIYIFKSNEVPFNNLTIEYLGRIKSGTKLYKKLYGESNRIFD